MFKDFGNGVEPESISDGDVSIRTLTWVREKELHLIAKSNKEQIDPYKLKDKNIEVLKTFGVFYKDSIVGSISFWLVAEDEVAISYWIDKNHYRLGIATKAIPLATEYMFEREGIQSFSAHILERNIASKNLMNKLGYTPTLRRVLNLVSGEQVHTIYRLDKN